MFEAPSDLQAMMAIAEAAQLDTTSTPSTPPRSPLPPPLADPRAQPSASWRPEHPNWALDQTTSRTIPQDTFACITCPKAIWLSGQAVLTSWCTVMRAETWSVVTPRQIEVCTAKELAILELQEQQALQELAGFETD